MPDPFYARSSLDGTIAEASAPKPTPEAGSGEPTDLGTSSATPPVDPAPEPAATPEDPPPAGETPAPQVPPEPSEAADGESTPEPAELTLEQKQAKVDELLEMVKKNPAKFAVEHGIDLAPRFAKLGHMAQELRKKEAELKELAAENESKVKEAQEALDLLNRDRVGFVEKYLGKDGMAKLNRAALAKDDPQYGAISRLEDVIDAQNAKIEELTKKLDGPSDRAEPEPIDPRIEAQISQKAHDFGNDWRQLAEHPENKRLIAFYGEDAVKEDSLQIVQATYRATREQLTADQVWSMLRTEFEERMQKINGTAPSAETPSKQPQQAGSESGPENEEPPPRPVAETDFSRNADRARMRAIAARHTKA